MYDAREPSVVSRAGVWQQSLHLDDISEVQGYLTHKKQPPLQDHNRALVTGLL